MALNQPVPSGGTAGQMVVVGTDGCSLTDQAAATALTTLGLTATAAEVNAVCDDCTATAAEITRVCDKSGSVVAANGATLTVTEALHGDRIIAFGKTDGCTVTLPAATGTGNRYTFIVSIAATSAANIIKVANATDVMEGMAIGADDDTEGAGTAHTWNCETSDDTITMNGTATGGKLGDRIEVIDYASGKFHVTAFLTQSGGAEATPFSATVS